MAGRKRMIPHLRDVRAAKLDVKGRCCGKKPLTYKTPPAHLYCDRCHSCFDSDTKMQIENWAWKFVGDNWVRTFA